MNIRQQATVHKAQKPNMLADIRITDITNDRCTSSDVCASYRDEQIACANPGALTFRTVRGRHMRHVIQNELVGADVL